ncbi:nitrite/sulfite reductase [Kitasatospora atroaurantiaca]|uniref:Precorrin-3B synthase n=1 Tax=Kitasatospora atroaurantiaca TaxID=285545 RepID=A0A561EYS4_9ACTN|nr:precorrin-3B synthase [Kitasatospora atroaurantiaca]
MLAAMPPTPDAAEPGPGAPDRGRSDACPGALRLHTADDGALARIRVPGGLLTVSQAMVLADAASELGDGELETTSRGNVQLRGLPSDSGLELGRRLRAAGLLPSDSHERVRNIVASPLAGLDGIGHADVQAWTRELDSVLCASDPAAALSGKFLFALDDGRGDVAGLDADVTLIARPDGTALLRLGRTATARRVPAHRAVPAALAAACEFLEACRESATKAWHVREAPELLDPGAEALPPLGTPPPVGAVPGGVSVGMRFGRVSAEQWRLLARTAAGELRVTPWRGVVLPGVPAERLADLAAAGFRTDPGSPWERATACTGRPGCAKSLADVRADAAQALDTARGGGLPVHWSGCERRCGHPAGEWVDVLATGQGYRVTVRPAETSHDVMTEQMAEAVAEARRTK